MQKHTISGENVMGADYGENPWQQCDGLYLIDEADDPLAIGKFAVEQGRDPSYNNVGDIDRLLQTATHIAAGIDINNLGPLHIAVGAKHGNMCGASVGDDVSLVTEQMLDGNSTSIFGGAVLINGPVDQKLANILMKHNVVTGKRLLDVVVGSSFDKQALDTLIRREEGKLRVLSNPHLASLGSESIDSSPRFRYVRGGFQVQQNYTFVPDFGSELWGSHNEKPESRQGIDIILAWAVGSTSTSNTITIVRDGMLLGSGVGQQDRVGAAKLAVSRAREAGHSIEGATAYSDSFFPFKDGAQVLINAGVNTIFTSSGSVRDPEVFTTIKSAGVNLYTLPDKICRGFYGH